MKTRKTFAEKFNDKNPDYTHAAHLTVAATEWLAALQLNKKMPNSLVARKMGVTGKHIKDIMGGNPTLEDLARMFYALGYKLHIYTEDIETGKKEMRQPELLPHALNHPHIRGQLKIKSKPAR
jgi:DNA-binding phage protein